MEPEYCSLRREWPGGDSIVTAFRYMLAAPFAKGKKVLDLGCGAGEGAPFFAGEAAEYVGLDRAAAWTEAPAAPHLPDKATFVEGDACDLPADWSGRFGLVVALELIEHLETPETLLEEIRRVLAPGGVAILSTPNFNLLSRSCDGSRRPLYRHHVREYTAAGFRKSLAAFDPALRITGLSHLAPGGRSGGKVALALGDTVVRLGVGAAYPQIEIERTESLPGGVPPEDCQSFVALIGADYEMPAPAKESRMSVDRVAVKSFEWVLRRRNEQMRQMQERLENLEGHCRDQEEIIAKKAGHAANLEQIAEQEARHAAELERIVATRDEEIERLRTRRGPQRKPGEPKSLKEAIEARDAKLMALEKVSQSRQEHAERLETAVASLKKHAHALETIVAARDAQIEIMKKNTPPVGRGEPVP